MSTKTVSEGHRGATVAAWWPWLVLPAAASSLVSVGLVLWLLTESDTRQSEVWVNVPLAIGFSTIAAGIWATRPHPTGLHRLAILYTVVGLGSAVVLPAYGWARAGLAGSEALAWVSNWVWALGAAPLLGLGLVLYPDGDPPGRRWWPVPALGIAGTVALVAAGMFEPGALGNHPQFTNPVGLGGTGTWDTLGGMGFLSLLAAAALGVLALAIRFRRAARGSDIRGQIGAVTIAGAVVVLAATLPIGNDVTSAVLAFTAGAVLPFTVGMAVVRHRLLDQRDSLEILRHRLDAVAASRRGLVTDREEERLRLRRELHDGLGPSLAAIGLGLRQLERSSGTDADTVRLLADEIQHAVAEVRRICDGLRPPALNELGLDGALRAALEPLERFGPSIALHLDPTPRVSPAVEVAAFRIAMEAATNAVRHAHADHVAVSVAYDDGLLVTVEDDGIGLPADLVPGVGLRGMSDRADELGGRLVARTRRAGGTEIRAWLPGGSA